MVRECWRISKSFMAMLILVFFTFSFLASCATTGSNIQEQWEALTPDEQARVVISGFQKQVRSLLISTEAYITANPKYLDGWKTKILPSADFTKKSLDALVDLRLTPNLTPDLVYSKIQPLINNLILLIGQIGAPVKTGGKLDTKFCIA